MKKLDSWLTVVMGVSVGLFLARLLYLLWDVNAHPALYAAQSAPWYCAAHRPRGLHGLVPGVGGPGKAPHQKEAEKAVRLLKFLIVPNLKINGGIIMDIIEVTRELGRALQN